VIVIMILDPRTNTINSLSVRIKCHLKPQTPAEHKAWIVCPWYVIKPIRKINPTSSISNLKFLRLRPDLNTLQTICSFNIDYLLSFST